MFEKIYRWYLSDVGFIVNDYNEVLLNFNAGCCNYVLLMKTIKNNMFNFNHNHIEQFRCN